MAAAWFFDGTNAVRRSVQVAAGPASLLIRGEAANEVTSVASQDLRYVESRPDVEIYGHAGIDGWRLGIAKPIPADIAALLPAKQVYGRWVDRVGLVPALLMGLMVSVFVVLLGLQFPAWVAPLVPKSWERNFGDALVGDLGGKFCASQEGQAALAKLGTRLGVRSDEIRIRVVNLPVVNAAALPGGTIVVFRQLIAKAKGPDELAGVVAHEMAHVERRHVTQMMIRQYGLGIIVAMLGGQTGASVDMLMAARYGRTAETQADDDAMATLARANISPLPTADFFKRLSHSEGRGTVASVAGYLNSHPLSDDRRRKFEQSARSGAAYAPALNDQEWRALRGICAAPTGQAGTAPKT